MNFQFNGNLRLREITALAMPCGSAQPAVGYLVIDTEGQKITRALPTLSTNSFEVLGGCNQKCANEIPVLLVAIDRALLTKPC